MNDGKKGAQLDCQREPKGWGALPPVQNMGTAARRYLLLSPLRMVAGTPCPTHASTYWWQQL
jgi:hypothetical protein